MNENRPYVPNVGFCFFSFSSSPAPKRRGVESARPKRAWRPRVSQASPLGLISQHTTKETRTRGQALRHASATSIPIGRQSRRGGHRDCAAQFCPPPFLPSHPPLPDAGVSSGTRPPSSLNPHGDRPTSPRTGSEASQLTKLASPTQRERVLLRGPNETVFGQRFSEMTALTSPQ